MPGKGVVVSSLSVLCLCTVLTVPVRAFDGKPGDDDHRNVLRFFRDAGTAMKDGRMRDAVEALQFAAEGGHVASTWKLGRIYAAGEGVRQNPLRAFEMFRRIAARNSEVPQVSADARFVASAYVQLGNYWLEGIPDTYVKATPQRAFEHYHYAASMYGDPEAQFRLGRLLIDGVGCARDPKQAAQWLSSAAAKSHHGAQALLGRMLFVGRDIPRQAPRGLMFLTLAKEGAGDEDEGWIGEIYDSAISQSSDEERTVALAMMKSWLEGKR